MTYITSPLRKNKRLRPCRGLEKNPGTGQVNEVFRITDQLSTRGAVEGFSFDCISSASVLRLWNKWLTREAVTEL